MQSIRNNTTVDVKYVAIPVEVSEWAEKVTIESKEGTLIKQYNDDQGNYVLVFSKDAVVNVKANSPYSHTDMKFTSKSSFEGWKNNDRCKDYNNSFEIERLQVKNGKRGNETEIGLNGKKIIVIIDKDVPVVNLDNDVMGWTNSNQVTLTGSVSDPNTVEKPSSGLSHIIWSKDVAMTKDEVLAATSNKVKIESDGTDSFDSVDGEQNSIYNIYAVDFAGNVSDAKSVNVRIDRKAPTVTAFTYSVTATLTDMAGNETTKTIVFSANRFGSVYTFDSFLKSIEGKYTNTEQDVVFTETNVDTLDHESIKLKLVKNGTPSDLKEGNDYTITTSGGNGQWSQYKYVVNKALFADDGNYRLTIYSMDAAGNVNENIDESKKAEISFGIDKTNPVIVPIDFESGKQYPVEVKNVKVEVKDNLVLESVKIYLNGEEVEYTVDGETYTFDIPKSNSKQDVKIVAVDAAGNKQPIEITDFLVNDNFFVRWYNNTPLFIGSIIGVVVIALGIVSLILFGKKKKKDDK